MSCLRRRGLFTRDSCRTDMLTSTCRNALKRGQRRSPVSPSLSSLLQDPSLAGRGMFVCRKWSMKLMMHTALRTCQCRLSSTMTAPSKITPWAFNQDSTFRGSVTQLARCQYEAISHAKGTRRLIPCLRLVREMKKEHVKPDLVIYNSLLACIAEEGLPLEAWAVVDDMHAMGIPPDRQSYHHILHVGTYSLTGVPCNLTSSRP